MLIFDCDNCISNDQWRLCYIDWEADNAVDRYHEYHLRAAYDSCVNASIIEGYPGEIIFFTAMPEYYAPIREGWFRRQGFKYTKCYYRRDEDHRHSVDVKRDMLFQLTMDRNLKNPQELGINYIFDDRDSVLKMFREEFNLPTRRMRVHDESAYHPPAEARRQG